MPSAPSTSDHAVALPDGSAAHYHLRGLRLAAAEEEGQEHPDDVARWTQFCASVFSYKPNPPPPAYFARHFHNDPRRDASLVRVLVHCPTNSGEEKLNGEIVASVRIFRRTLSCGPGGCTLEAGGIGEVCTSPEHQRRGLSKILLKDALSIMSKSSKEEDGMKCSLLHANPDFRPVYAKVGGYASVRSEWSVVPVRLQNLTSKKTSDDWTIRAADCKRDAEQLQKIHREYSEKRLITIIRSEQYWQEYVGAELGNTLLVIARPTDGAEKILAWISIRKRGDRYQLREFGVNKREGSSVVRASEGPSAALGGRLRRFLRPRGELLGKAHGSLAGRRAAAGAAAVRTSWALRQLLGVALDQAGEAVGSEKEVPLVMPTFVLSELRGESSADGAADFLDVERATQENDDGWMHVTFDDIAVFATLGADPVPHLIWPTDSF